MNCIISNKFIIKNTFCSAKEIVEQESSLDMGSLDVDWLFTDIPLDETIDICTNTIYNEQDVIQGISKEEFRNIFIASYKRILFYFQQGFI